MKMIILFSYYWWVHAFYEWVHALYRRFHAFEKGGFTLLKKTGVRIDENNVIFILLGVHAFEKEINIFGKGGSRLCK